jgi:hypothetical protein
VKTGILGKGMHVKLTGCKQSKTAVFENPEKMGVLHMVFPWSSPEMLNGVALRGKYVAWFYYPR